MWHWVSALIVVALVFPVRSAVLWHAMLCCATLCYALLCYALLDCVCGPVATQPMGACWTLCNSNGLLLEMYITWSKCQPACI